MKRFYLSFLSSVLLLGMLFTPNVSAGTEVELAVEDIAALAESTVIAEDKYITVHNLLESPDFDDSDASLTAFPPYLQFANSFNFSNRDFGQSVVQTADGGYVVAGSTTVLGDEDILFIKTDAFFNLQFAYAFGGADAETGVEVRQTADGGYIIAGTSSGSSYSDIYLIKTDSSGGVQWARTYPTPAREQAHALEIGHDGGYIIVGRKESSSNSHDAYMLKVDANGNVQWNRSFGEPMMEDNFYGVALTPEGGYVAVGSKTVYEFVDGFHSYTMHGYMVKVSGTGTTIFANTLARYGNLKDVVVAPSGYIATGSIYDSSTVYDIYVTKVSTNGYTNWTRQFHATNGDFANGITLAPDGNVVVTGFTTPQVSKENLVLLKLDQAGNDLWSTIIDFGDSGEIPQSVAVTNDGGYVVTGHYLYDGIYDALLVKFSSD